MLTPMIVSDMNLSGQTTIFLGGDFKVLQKQILYICVYIIFIRMIYITNMIWVSEIWRYNNVVWTVKQLDNQMITQVENNPTSLTI